MLRALLLVLLLANAGFFAWSQDWLAPWLPARSERREPERLAAQVQPERVRVLTAGAASAAAAAAAASVAVQDAGEHEAAPLCLEAGPFTDAAARAALVLLAEHGVPDGAVEREVVARNHTWGVVIGRLSDREALRVRAEELRRLNIRHEELTTPPALVPALRLGNFSDRYGAETALAQLTGKGVRDARVVPLPLGPTQQWLRATNANAELQTRLKSLPPERLERGFQPCVQRPQPAPG
ncbi:MAG: hypothetical protein IT501_05895 [Rubrivivax sp.]|nr:hypothetical protein [Rubrivivax sp.]